MKNFLRVFLVFCLAVVCLAAFSSCDRLDEFRYDREAKKHPSYEAFVYLPLDNDTYAVALDLTGNYLEEIMIPRVYNGKKVSTIVESGFSYFQNIKNVIISDSVTSIGKGAFEGCTGLTSIVIPDSVTSIGEQAFDGCENITIATIPASASRYIPRTKKLQTVVITSGSKIGERAFSDCAGLTSITIPNSVTSIGSSAFSGCIGLTSIEIPDSVTSISYRAFYGCTKLTSIEIPDSVTSIYGYAFGGCTVLASVTFENTTGWKTDTVAISSTDLANKSTAATYLKNTYCSHRWTRE